MHEEPCHFFPPFPANRPAVIDRMGDSIVLPSFADAVVDGFVDLIRGRPSRVTSIEGALDVMELVEALRRSALG